MSDGLKLYLTLHSIVTCVKSYQIHPSVAQPGSCSEAGVAPRSFPQSGAGFSPNLSAVAVLSLCSGHSESCKKPKLSAAPLLDSLHTRQHPKFQ